MDDSLDDFLGFDFAIGADETKCPQCGAMVPSSLFFETDVIDCPKCGKKFKKS